MNPVKLKWKPSVLFSVVLLFVVAFLGSGQADDIFEGAGDPGPDVPRVTGSGETLILVTAGQFSTQTAAQQTAETLTLGSLDGFYVDASNNYQVKGVYVQTSPDSLTGSCPTAGLVTTTLEGQPLDILCPADDAGNPLVSSPTIVPPVRLTYVDASRYGLYTFPSCGAIGAPPCQRQSIEALLGTSLQLQPERWLVLTAFRTKAGAESFMDLARSRSISDLVAFRAEKLAGEYVGLGQEESPDGTGPLLTPLSDSARYQVANAYNDLVLRTAGLTGYWTMNDTGSLAVNSYDTSLTGIYKLKDNLTLQQPGIFGPQAPDKAVFFNYGYVHVPNHPALEPQSFTWEMWLKPKQFSDPSMPEYINGRPLITKSYTSGYHIALEQHGAVSARVGQVGPSSSVTTSTGVVTVETWNHIVVTYDDRPGNPAGASLAIYVNGILRASANVARKTITASDLMIVWAPDNSLGTSGALNGANNPANTKVTADEVAFYSRALSAAEIEHHNSVGRSQGFYG